MKRFRSAAVLAAVLAFLLPLTAASVTLHGNLRYGGSPVSATFPHLASAVVNVYNRNNGKTSIYQVPVADTYEVPEDVEAGSYILTVLLSPDAGRRTTIAYTGDLFAAATIDVPDDDSYTVDLDLTDMVRLVAPLDSKQVWPGPGIDDCPLGVEVPKSFTLAWESAPGAVRTVVTVRRMPCSGGMVIENHEVTGSSTQLVQQQTADEKYMVVSLTQYDENDQPIAENGHIRYMDGTSIKSAIFRPPSASRPIHTAGQIISQVAHIQGASFWKTDLVLTNPTTTDIPTDLYYTPRGADGLTGALTAHVIIPAGASRTYADMLQQLFERTGAGALEVASPTLVAMTRTGTPAPGGGSYGQGVPAVLPEQILTDVETQVASAGGVVRSQTGAGFARSNLALNEVWGEPATVRVQLLDSHGTPLGLTMVLLPAYGNTQINDLVKTLGHRDTLTGGQVRVQLQRGPGRVAATLFIVDASNDPSAVPLLTR